VQHSYQEINQTYPHLKTLPPSKIPTLLQLNPNHSVDAVSHPSSNGAPAMEDLDPTENANMLVTHYLPMASETLSSATKPPKQLKPSSIPMQQTKLVPAENSGTSSKSLMLMIASTLLVSTGNVSLMLRSSMPLRSAHSTTTPSMHLNSLLVLTLVCIES